MDPINAVKKEILIRRLARKDLKTFVGYMNEDYQFSVFHKAYISVMQKFLTGEIKNLIVTIGPQQGKSEISTKLLPAALMGVNPDLRIALASYSSTQATKFHRAVQRYMDSRHYTNISPDTKIPDVGAKIGVRNTEETEILNHKGVIRAVGRGGALTGNTVDVAIIDDLYKDAMEAHSPIIREGTIEWYDTVLATRLHNDSQQLIVFTRWHEDDLVGYLEKNQRVITLDSLAQIDQYQQAQDLWFKINFPAIKEGGPTELDPRKEGEALWPDRHSLEKLENYRKKNPGAFASLYQGNPKPAEGLLYSEFETYTKLPKYFSKTNLVCDSADKGSDNLCAINYKIGLDHKAYVTDILYTDEGMETTEPEVARMIVRNSPDNIHIESNNGGEGFARSVKRILKGAGYQGPMPITFHQKENKEARIISNATLVNTKIIFPDDWATRWPRFYRDVTNFRRLFKANSHDDGPDTLTLAVEKAGFIGGQASFITLDVF